ncbi:MAG: flavodoxin family protein [Anaerolineae bacterium]
MVAADTRRKLIVYYTFTGGTRVMAEAAASVLGADLAEINLLKPLPSFLPWLYVWGGMQANLRRLVAIKPLEHNAEAYDIIFIGTPVWGRNMAPAVRSWLAQQRLQDKTIACFASGGVDPGQAFTDMRALLPGNKFQPDLIIQDAVHNKLEAARQVREWISSLHID